MRLSTKRMNENLEQEVVLSEKVSSFNVERTKTIVRRLIFFLLGLSIPLLTVVY